MEEKIQKREIGENLGRQPERAQTHEERRKEEEIKEK